MHWVVGSGQCFAGLGYSFAWSGLTVMLVAIGAGFGFVGLVVCYWRIRVFGWVCLVCSVLWVDGSD